jgi:hypothetical protein
MKTDWGEMLRFAARLGLPPADFWRVSLREWRMLTASPAAPEAMGRAVFERLAEAWPDD